MGDGRTRRKAPPERQQHDDANTPHADGQFDLFGVPADAARASPENDGPPADTDEHVNPGAPDDAQPAPRPRTHARSSDETPPAASGLLWDEPSLPAEPPKKGRRRRGVLPAPITPDVADAAAGLPPNVRLGTSSWYFPAGTASSTTAISLRRNSREGAEAYGAHPLLKSVSLDRSFYGPLSVADYLRYAQQVPTISASS